MPIFLPPTMLAGITEQSVTWDPISKGPNITLSNGNLDEDGAANWNSVRATIGKTAGKWYCEFLVQSITSAGNIIGFIDGSGSLATYIGNSASGRGAQNTGTSFTSGFTSGSAQSGFAAGNIVALAFDMGTGKGFIAVNNVWQGSSDPLTQTNPFVTGLTGTVYVAASAFATGNKNTIRPNNNAFTYSPPTGYQSYATP